MDLEDPVAAVTGPIADFLAGFSRGESATAPLLALQVCPEEAVDLGDGGVDVVGLVVEVEVRAAVNDDELLGLLGLLVGGLALLEGLGSGAGD